MKIFHLLQAFLAILIIAEDRFIKKLAESAKVHGDLIIESHQLRRGIEILGIDTFIQRFDGALD